MSKRGANRLQVSEDGYSAHCELVALKPFSPALSTLSYESALGIELAIRHLNEGNGSIVLELTDLPKSCPISFSASFADTQQNEKHAFSLVDDMTAQTCGDTNSSSLPCAFVGAVDSQVSRYTALVTSLREFPQISAASISSSLEEFPLFGRTCPDDSFMAETLVRFLYETIGVRHFFVLFEPHPTTESILETLRDAIRRLGWAPSENDDKEGEFMYMQEKRINNSPEVLSEAIQELKDSQVRFVVPLTRLRSLNDALMKVAYERGVAGAESNYHWWFVLMEGTLDNRVFLPREEDLAKAYDGAGSIAQTYDKGGWRHDMFLRQCSELKQELYNEYYSTNSSRKWLFLPEEPFLNEDQWFVDGNDFAYDGRAAYAYDATVLLGLSACSAVSESSVLYLTGTDYFETIKQTNFTGVSGDVVLDPTTGTRDGDSVEYIIKNWLASKPDEEGSVNFRSSESYTYAPGGDDTWEELRPFIFSGNKTLQELGDNPDLSPVDPTYNQVGVWLIVLSALLSFIIIASCIGCAIWIFRNRNSRVVRASQPFFLLLLCIGTGLSGLSIIPASLEHYQGSQVACHSYFVLVIIGTGITMSTLFAKTYRINQIMDSAKTFRRIKLSVADTIYPVAMLLVFNIIMLSLMISLRPIIYDDVIVKRDIFERPTVLYATCSRKEAMPFYYSIWAVNFVVICLALFQVWRARQLSTEFAESKYIAGALLITAIVVVLSVPLLILVENSPTADTFINVFMVFITTASLVGCIFIPKIKMFHDLKNEKQTPSNKVGIGSSAKKGEKIVTTKPQQQLAAEVKSLERELTKVKKEKAYLQERAQELSSETSTTTPLLDECAVTDDGNDSEMYDSESESSDDEMDEPSGNARGSIIAILTSFSERVRSNRRASG